MLKKIEIFFGVILALAAVLLLMAIGSRKPAETGEKEIVSTTQATEPMTQATETTAPPTVPEPQPTDPTKATTEPTEQQETEPEAAVSPVEEVEIPEASEENLQRVRQILEAAGLSRTARSHWVWNQGLNYLEGTTGSARSTNGWALALVAAERKMNPIAGFLVLEKAGLYSQAGDDSGVLSAAAFAVPEQGAKEYAYTEAGARQLVTDVLGLASGMEDGLAMESILLGANGAVDQGQMALSRSEDCYYGYFISGGERSTHILCFYLRSGRDGKLITDVEFQLLNLRSSGGGADALAVLDRRGDNQAATLIAAAELLMTGQTQAGQGMTPFHRQVTTFHADIERFYFTAENEVGTMTNYRLRKA